MKTLFTFIIVILYITAFAQKKDNATSLKSKDEKTSFQTLTKREGYLHEKFNKLLKAYVSNDGKVNYDGFKESHNDLRSYIHILKIAHKDVLSVTKSEQLAYWINAYNALTIDLILKNYPLNSIKDIKDPWKQKLWQFGNDWLNLNDIEHKILRKMNEPRIHFAIVCASESCPKLINEAYKGSILEEQLSKSTKLFLEDVTKNEITENELKLSKIFKWFAKDFKSSGGVINFINNHSDFNISSKAKKSYLNYDWSLNE